MRLVSGITGFHCCSMLLLLQLSWRVVSNTKMDLERLFPSQTCKLPPGEFGGCYRGSQDQERPVPCTVRSECKLLHVQPVRDCWANSDGRPLHIAVGLLDLTPSRIKAEAKPDASGQPDGKLCGIRTGCKF